jgi:hypothetical protein
MTERYTQITEKNVHSFGIGTRVRFNYGPMCGGEIGLVVDYEITRFGAQLIAETERGETKTISGFSTIGVGCYLLERMGA